MMILTIQFYYVINTILLNFLRICVNVGSIYQKQNIAQTYRNTSGQTTTWPQGNHDIPPRDDQETLYNAIYLFYLKLHSTLTNQMTKGKLRVWLGTSLNLFLFKILNPPSKDKHEPFIWKAERKHFTITFECFYAIFL